MEREMKDAKIIEDLKKDFEKLWINKQTWAAAKFTTFTLPSYLGFIGLLFSTGLAISLCIFLPDYLIGFVNSDRDLAVLILILYIIWGILGYILIKFIEKYKQQEIDNIDFEKLRRENPEFTKQEHDFIQSELRSIDIKETKDEN